MVLKYIYESTLSIQSPLSTSNSELMDLFLFVLQIDSAKRPETDTTSIFLDECSIGNVSATNNFFNGELLILSKDSPENTACVQAPYISLAPFFFKAFTAFTNVPPVSIRSSIIRIFFSVYFTDYVHDFSDIRFRSSLVN